MRAEISYFHSSLTNLVVWAPDFRGIWKPANLGKSRITGHEEFVEIALLRNMIRIRYQNSVTDGRNRVVGHNSFNRRLVFTPRYTTSYTVQITTGYLGGSYTVRKVDRAYTNASNTRYYEPYRTDDIALQGKLPLGKHWQIKTHYAVNNLRDVQYVLLAHYPMPGRQWQVGFSLTYTGNKN